MPVHVIDVLLISLLKLILDSRQSILMHEDEESLSLENSMRKEKYTIILPMGLLLLRRTSVKNVTLIIRVETFFTELLYIIRCLLPVN